MKKHIKTLFSFIILGCIFAFFFIINASAKECTGIISNDQITWSYNDETDTLTLTGDGDSVLTELDVDQQMYENFHKQFHQLSYHEQRVLYLRYVEELSLKEISEKLHIQKSSVNTLLCRIRKKARKLISEQMDEGGNQNE